MDRTQALNYLLANKLFALKSVSLEDEVDRSSRTKSFYMAFECHVGDTPEQAWVGVLLTNLKQVWLHFSDRDECLKIFKEENSRKGGALAVKDTELLMLRIQEELNSPSAVNMHLKRDGKNLTCTLKCRLAKNQKSRFKFQLALSKISRKPALKIIKRHFIKPQLAIVAELTRQYQELSQTHEAFLDSVTQKTSQNSLEEKIMPDVYEMSNHPATQIIWNAYLAALREPSTTVGRKRSSNISLTRAPGGTASHSSKSRERVTGSNSLGGAASLGAATATTTTAAAARGGDSRQKRAAVNWSDDEADVARGVPNKRPRQQSGNEDEPTEEQLEMARAKRRQEMKEKKLARRREEESAGRKKKRKKKGKASKAFN